MDLRKLEIFAEVARQRNFSRAAEKLHMAQPPVSIAVRKLEDELGAQLFVREKRDLQLTEEGREVLKRAEQIFVQMDELTHSVGRYQNLLKGQISLACPAMVGTYFLPQLLGSFLDQHAGLTASVTQAGTTKIEQMLLRDEIELGVVTLDEPNPELEIIALLAEPMVVCVGAKHPLRQYKQVTFDQLDGVSMILYERDYAIRQRFDQLCLTYGFTPEIRLQTNYLPLITKLVKQHHGATVGLSIMAQEEVGIFAVELKPQINIAMGIACRRGRAISRANQGFLEWLGRL